MYKQLPVKYVVINFATSSYAFVYTRSVSLHTTLTPKFCQATKIKMFVHIGFVNLYAAATTNVNISN